MGIALELERIEQQARSTGLTTTQIQKVLNDVSEKVTGDTLKAPTVQEYLTEWLQTAKTRITKTTWVRYEHTVKIFLGGLGNKAKMPITSVTPKNIEDFLNQRLSSGIAPKTAIIDLKTLNTAFSRAESYGMILKNPLAPVRRPKEDSSEREVFTHEEVQRLLDAAPNVEWQTLIMLGYFVGARLSDCAHMKWENIDPERGIIVYHPRKTGKKVVVPMHFHVIEHLQHLATFGTEGYLSPTLVKRVSGGENGLSGAFRRIVERAGIDPGLVAGKGIRRFSKRSFHSLRHSFNSNLANAGVAEEIRMKLTGHSSRDMNARYTHLELNSLRNAMELVPTFTKETKE